MSNNLPGGQMLAKGENLLKRTKFMSSISTFYIKTDFAVTDKRFIAHYPKIVLGFLPLGFDNFTFNLKQISGINIDIEYKIFKIILGILSFLFISGSGGILMFILGIIFGIIFLASGIQISIAVSNTSGGVLKCPIVFFEKGKAKEFIKEFNSMLVENT